jgi:hypothetical protein
MADAMNEEILPEDVKQEDSPRPKMEVASKKNIKKKAP